MSFELRLKLLRESWMQIQEKSNELKELQAQMSFHRKKVHSLKQKIPTIVKEREKMLADYGARL